MDEGCMHDCQHPLWGGDGFCLHDDDGAPGMCSCDAGFASRDAFGNASCVPIRVLVTGYLVLAIASVLTASVLLWHAYQYRHLSLRSRSTARTTQRMRLLLSASVFVLGHLGIGFFLAVRAGETGVYDAGVLQIIYILLIPSTMFATSMAANFWVEGLPSQLFTSETFAGKLRFAAEKYNLFVVIGVINAGTISAMGVMTFFVPAWPQLIADLAIAVGSVLGVTVFLFVAVQITGVINSSMSKGSASSRAYYIKAKRNVWVQASAFATLGIVLFVVIAIKQLTLSGRSTPIILWTVEMLIAHTCSTLFTCSTQFEMPRDGLAFGATSRFRTGRGLSTFMSRTSSFQGGSAAQRRVSDEWHEFVLRFMAGLSGGTQPLPLQQDERHELHKGICGDVDVGGRGDDNEDIVVQDSIKSEDSGLMAKGTLDIAGNYRKGNKRMSSSIGLQLQEEGEAVKVGDEVQGLDDGGVGGRDEAENKSFVKVRNMPEDDSGLVDKRNKTLGGNFSKGSKTTLPSIELQSPEGRTAVALGAEVPGVEEGDVEGGGEDENESLVQVSIKPEDSGLMAKRNQSLGGNYRKGSKRVLPSIGLQSPKGGPALAVSATVLGVGDGDVGGRGDDEKKY